MKIIKGIVLAVVALATVFIVFTSLNVFGLQMFVVNSGSMEPKIHTGSVVIDHKADNYKVGDVITFKISGSANTATHRIVTVNNDGTGVTYQVKGDANNSPDPDLVPAANIVGKVKFSIPLVGYLVAFIKTLPGLVIFIIIPATIVVYQELINIKTEIQGLKKAKKVVAAAAKKVEDEIAKEEKKLVVDEKRLWARIRTWLSKWKKDRAHGGIENE